MFSRGPSVLMARRVQAQNEGFRTRRDLDKKLDQPCDIEVQDDATLVVCSTCTTEVHQDATVAVCSRCVTEINEDATMVACLTAHPTTITEFPDSPSISQPLKPSSIARSTGLPPTDISSPASTTTSAPLPKGGPTVSSTQSSSIPRSKTSILLWSSSPPYPSQSGTALSGTTTASNSSQPIHFKHTHFPWPTLAGPVGFLIVFTAAFWFYLRRKGNLRHKRMRPEAPTDTAKPPSTLAAGMSDMGSGAEPLVPPQSPVMETMIASPGADDGSIHATFGSAGSISMRSTTGASTTESKETSGDAMGRESQAMAEWASLRRLPQLVAGNDPCRGTTPAEESAQGQSYMFPTTESICSEDSAPEAQGNFLAQPHGVAGVDDRSGQQDHHSTMAQRNMSVSGESITTIMTDPPPPYSAGPDPGESFNPANFDLSLVTTRVGHMHE